LFLESRYVSREHHSYTPKINLTSGVIRFKLDPWASPSLYELQDTLIFIKGRIVDSTTNDVPVENARVSVVQNIIASLWTKVEVKLNGVELKIPITILADPLKGQNSFSTTSPWPNNTAPSKCIIGFDRESSFNGTQTTNLFNFLRKFGMCYIEHLSLNLNQKPMGALEGDQTKNDCLIDYYRMDHFLAFTVEDLFLKWRIFF
jgi:hypothetical protein